MFFLPHQHGSLANWHLIEPAVQTRLRRLFCLFRYSMTEGSVPDVHLLEAAAHCVLGTSFEAWQTCRLEAPFSHALGTADVSEGSGLSTKCLLEADCRAAW